jgi:hypothetical protein
MAQTALPHTANTYYYTPLPDPTSQIRLLTIPLDLRLYLGYQSLGPLTGKLATYDIPVGSLSRTRRLLRASLLPLFYALSYVWGDATKIHEIWIDGKRLAITRNLYLALRSMQSGGTGTIHLWADAICINQEDNVEKSSQIQLMRDIYHAASEVRIWLGLSTPETQRCLRFVTDLTGVPNTVFGEPNEAEEPAKALFVLGHVLAAPATAFARGGLRLSQGLVDFADIVFDRPPTYDDTGAMGAFERHFVHQAFIHPRKDWRPSESKLKSVEKREGDFSEVAKLIDKLFMQHAWFTRMWVVQEVCCARSCELQVGSTTLSWDGFIKAVIYLYLHKGFQMDNILK